MPSPITYHRSGGAGPVGRTAAPGRSRSNQVVARSCGGGRVARRVGADSVAGGGGGDSAQAPPQSGDDDSDVTGSFRVRRVVTACLY